MGEDLDYGELFSDDLLELVLELMSDFQGWKIPELVDNFWEPWIDLCDLGLAFLNNKIAQFNVFPLPDT